ncbi:MAG TPA: fibronectin type III domain-containing protein, partial [Bacteroidales bacterium]|nr:fibronectin type III domain-containing protein [Bacteroidales bacterium]
SQSITFTTLPCIVPCNPPTGLTTSNITTTGATLSWTADTAALYYVVHYRPVTNPVSAWINVNAQTTSVTLSNLTCGTQYEWQVASICTYGSIGAYSQSITFSTLACVVPCNPPTGLTTSNITTTGATLSWTAATGAYVYVVQYRPVTNPVSAWISVTTQNTSINLSNLTCGTQYEWQVASHCSSNTLSAYSPSITFSTLACVVPCNPPTGLTTTNITTTGATLSWTADTGALAYMVQYRPVTNPVSPWISVTTQNTSITLTNLTCGTVYEWRIASYCGTSPNQMSIYSQIMTFSTLPCITPCNPPTGLTTSNITMTGATLSWTAATGALAYVVHYRPVTNPISPWINVNTQTPSVTLSNLTCGTQYEWQVASICTYGSIGAFSQSVTFSTLPCIVPCIPPTGLTTSMITTSSAVLSWTAPTGSLAFVVQYRPVTNPVSPWINLTVQTTSLTLSNLTCGTPYEWHVASYCGNGITSSYSQSVNFSTLSCTNPCVPPTGLTTSNITATGATLSWTAATGALAYRIQYRPVTYPASAWINVTTQATLFALTNLACGTQYEWRVASYCGNSLSQVSIFSPIITFSTLPCTVPCNPPTSLTTSNITMTGATLSWTASAGALAYMIQYRPVTNPVSSWISLTAQNTSITLTNLTCGTAYEWRIASYCGTSPNQMSIYSQIITFSTLPCITPCNPPTGLTTTNITSSGATLSWTAIPGVLAYRVQYRPVTTPVSQWNNVTTQNPTLSLHNLTCGRSYEWRVASYCGNGIISMYSQSIIFSTLPCITPCNPPTNLTTSMITAHSAILSWTAPAGALAYRIQYRPVTTPVSAWTNITAQNTTVTLSNLTCGRQYEWRVASYCGTSPNHMSAFSIIVTFSTLPCISPCSPPTGLTTGNITTTGATVSWTAVPGAIAYMVRYRPVTVPVSAWSHVYSLTTSLVLSNLTCGSQYEWQVASNCGSNAISAYSPVVTFATLACQTLCAPPTGLVTNNITTTGATLTWTPVTGALNYLIRYRPVTNPLSAWIISTTQTTSVTLSNLTCGTHYEWQVATYCDTNSISTYSPGITFSTPACVTPCNPPAGLTTSNISATGATLSWTAVTGAYVYVVQYRPVTNPASTWINIYSSGTSVTLSNLTCGTQYEWQVAAHCGPNISYTYSQSITFTTLPCTVPCNTPTDLTTSNITSTGATLSWTAPAGALAYIVQYRPVTTPVSAWTTVTVQNTSITLTNLTGGTHYEWQVRSVCSTNLGSNNVSLWSAMVYFHTLTPIVIYPNPVADHKFYLDMNNEVETKMSFVITDKFGSVVQKYDKTVLPGKETLDLDVSNLKNGVYFVHIQGKNINELQKIVIMR